MTKLWQRDAPIIRRIDENDVYKIMMMYFIWKYYPNLTVQFGFKNRSTTIKVGDYVSVWEVQEQLTEVSRLRFTDEVIQQYRAWGLFEEGFLEALKNLELTPPTVEKRSGELSIQITGRWFEVTLWEIYILAIVSELYAKGYARKEGITETQLFLAGKQRLDEKIEFFKRYPQLMISQFGLRRRLSGLFEEYGTERLLTETSVLTGVSNMYLASLLGVEAQGTNAHELPMVLTALASHSSPSAMRGAIYEVLEKWQKLFNNKSLIMLDDTYGSDVFRRQLPISFLEDYRGFRHDSGDPFQYGEDTIRLYQESGIDPQSKLIIFSDGLKPQLAVDLFSHFAGRIQVAFGMGTNLTNDTGLVTPLSLVMKVATAAGKPAVKLSNNLNKATGQPEAVQYYKEVFGYTNTARQKVVY